MTVQALPVTWDDVEAAAERIAPHIRRTPLWRSEWINAQLQAEVWIKAENLQEAGAFKSRGACNAVFSLSNEAAARGVATHSSGNHAAALARAASRRGIPAYIVMPGNAPQLKVDAVKSFGGQITFCEPTLAARETTAEEVVQRTGATFIHPYDHPHIIAGQATAARELIQEVPKLELLVAPVGGGGLLAGTLIAGKHMLPELEIWAAEPRGADDAYRSWQAGHLIPQTDPRTIADGLRTSVGVLNFQVMQALLDRIVLAEESTIGNTVADLWREHQWVVEPSGVVPLAALRDLEEAFAGRRIGLIFSGGNVDIESFLADEFV